MSLHAVDQTAVAPTVAELLRRAERIGAVARERAVTTETARQVSGDLIDEISGVFWQTEKAKTAGVYPPS